MSDRDIKTIQENVFNIADADNCYCRLWTFSIGHKILEIKFLQPNDATYRDAYIGFDSVEYFSGATSWTSANFRLHPQQDCITLLEQHNPKYVKMFRDNNIMDRFFLHLYSVQTKEGNLIQIIAANAGVAEPESK